MPVVMLLLILMPLTMAGELCMLCQCLFLGRGRRAEGWPFWPGPSCSCWRSGWGAAPCWRRRAWAGGGGCPADWWRQLPSPRLRWPSSCPGAAYAAPGGREPLGRICSYLTVLVLAACLGLLSMLGLWRDRVREWEGQTVVAEYSGIFRETGYRYVNWFVHGEQVYVWED